MSAITTETLVPTGTWAVDPVHTTIGFQVTDTSDLFSVVNGRFIDVAGRVIGGEDPSFTGTIRVDSLRTDNEQRDKHLISPDFLDAPKHPEIRFRSTSVEPGREGHFVLSGELIVKETPFEIELEARVRGLGRGKAGDERLVIDARGSFDWGTTTVELTAAVSASREA
jgi:polyisoprenoid-binding protein YceI